MIWYCITLDRTFTHNSSLVNWSLLKFADGGAYPKLWLPMYVSLASYSPYYSLFLGSSATTPSINPPFLNHVRILRWLRMRFNTYPHKCALVWLHDNTKKKAQFTTRGILRSPSNECIQILYGLRFKQKMVFLTIESANKAEINILSARDTTRPGP